MAHARNVRYAKGATEGRWSALRARTGATCEQAARCGNRPYRVHLFRCSSSASRSRIGREASETGYVIKQLAQAGVEIFEYMHGRSLTPKTWLDKAMSAVQSAADEAHREQTSERVHESHTRSAKAGHVVGGRVFGYTNQDVFNGVDLHGRPLRSHVERVINPTEAAVVRRIFALYDTGEGLKRIAKTLMQRRRGGPEAVRAARPDEGAARHRLVAVDRAGDPHARAVSRRHRVEQDAQAPDHVGAGRSAARVPSRSGCAPRPSTCGSSTNDLWRRVAGSPAGDRRPSCAVRERPSVGPTTEARDAESARGTGHVRAVRRRVDRRDGTAQARPGARVCLLSAPGERQLHERAADQRRGAERGRAASGRGTRAHARGHRAGDPSFRT